MADPSMETRVAVLEQIMSSTKADLDSMKLDLRELNIKMTQLITAATVSKKLVGAGLGLIGIVWPVIYGVIFLSTR